MRSVNYRHVDISSFIPAGPEMPFQILGLSCIGSIHSQGHGEGIIMMNHERDDLQQ